MDRCRAQTGDDVNERGKVVEPETALSMERGEQGRLSTRTKARTSATSTKCLITDARFFMSSWCKIASQTHRVTWR